MIPTSQPGLSIQATLQPSTEALREALLGTLTAAAVSVPAKALVSQVVGLVEDADAATRTRQPATNRRSGVGNCVEAFLGDLLLNSPRLTYLPTQAQNFSGKAIGSRTFRRVSAAMQVLGLVGLQKSFRSRMLFAAPGAPAQFGKSWAPRLWPSLRLLTMAAEFGIVDDMWKHFARTQVLTGGLIGLRGKSSGVGEFKARGKRMRLPKGPHLEGLQAEVAEINAAIAAADVEGCPLPILRRSFSLSLGDDGRPPLHGRWYAEGRDNYVQMKKAQRPTIRIAGERVVEADVSASHVWCFYGAAQRLGMGFGAPTPSTDLYGVSGLPRPVVKAFLTATFGNGRMPSKWPKGTVQKFLDQGIPVRDYPVQCVRERVLQHHPILGQIDRVIAAAGLHDFPPHDPKSLCALWLMGIEAQALSQALLRLWRDNRIVSLPLHDGLIIGERMQETAVRTLEEAYAEIAGVMPLVNVKDYSGKATRRNLE
ncbi:hypothetical protein [Falsiroseomonas sp. E2-1-a20]|uniref:hypothetical protein n=1 Tax=Falsiroseomonas sp. E2-1-a20 TaxID=3239300 RepID=UPI003F2BEDBE